MKCKAIFFSLLLLPLTSIADGSVNFKDHLVPILQKKPLLLRFVQETFTLDGDPTGVRIANEAAPGLGGTRLGPYAIPVIWHSAKGDVRAVLTLNTTATFYDGHGHVLGDDIRGATSVSESPDSISLAPAN